MRFDIVTLFPELIHQYFQYGVVKRAVENQLISVDTWNPRDYTADKHQTVDDKPYGGGPGMVLKYQPLKEAVLAIKKQSSAKSRVVYLSPKGQVVDNQKVKELSELDHLILISARYEGVDQRFIDHCVDEELSVGDYILSGGELPALVVIDSVSRMIPGVLGCDESANDDSFSAGLLEFPHYTRPEIVDSMAVPKILLSGNHQAIAQWRMCQSLKLTHQRRPDLLKLREFSKEQTQYLEDIE
ncbi:MAG: tRNA (guanosine(37)-N1)-methyltransferase TrmD [Methylococcales bacterium]|jgi:tRNA (guanine37-N1)-methyltransferase|nr:tRNA (guanosine(37)-N1)-methyltransferase TrmD [Methylococcales bacterium]MBT7408608.1 tRNA (guanosine(37)-N1)-methyltransferase TrmD [Methylococcales bacterium]